MAPLSVVVRFHNMDRLFELRRAIFSLICQTYRPLTICLVTQRLSDADLEQLRVNLASILSIDEAVGFEIFNYREAEPKDARSVLLNLGIKHSNGRYLAFLDHDDTIFADSYQRLIDELTGTGSAAAFGSIAMKDIDVFQDALLVENRRAVFVGENLIDFFYDNFCPIHSFMLDRSRIDMEELRFDSTLTKLEDYELLLRLCARYTSSFGLIGTFVGDYYIKNDGSNTLMFDLKTPEDRGAEWIRCDTQIQDLKDTRILSPEVQRQLGIVPPDPALSIRKLLANLRPDRTA